MEVTIEIKSSQQMEKEVYTIEQMGKGNICYYPKGTVLQWEIIEEGQIYEMLLLDHKIRLKQQEQIMEFIIGKTTHTKRKTPYGNMQMSITTQDIKLYKQKGQIQTIQIYYEIQIETQKPYSNQVEINVIENPKRELSK